MTLSNNTRSLVFNHLSSVLLYLLCLAYAYFRRGMFADTVSITGYTAILLWGALIISASASRPNYDLLGSSIAMFFVYILFSYLQKSSQYIYYINIYQIGMYFSFIFFHILCHNVFLKYPVQNIHIAFLSFFPASLYIVSSKFSEIIGWINLSGRTQLYRPYLPPLSLIMIIYLILLIAIYITTIFFAQYTIPVIKTGVILYFIYIFGLIIFGIIETPTRKPLTFEECVALRDSTTTRIPPRSCFTLDGRRISE